MTENNGCLAVSANYSSTLFNDAAKEFLQQKMTGKTVTHTM